MTHLCIVDCHFDPVVLKHENKFVNFPEMLIIHEISLNNQHLSMNIKKLKESGKDNSVNDRRLGDTKGALGTDKYLMWQKSLLVIFVFNKAFCVLIIV